MNKLPNENGIYYEFMISFRIVDIKRQRIYK